LVPGESIESGWDGIGSGKDAVESIDDPEVASTMSGIAFTLRFFYGNFLDLPVVVIVEPKLMRPGALVGFAPFKHPRVP
jgi:hypothetical protein